MRSRPSGLLAALLLAAACSSGGPTTPAEPAAPTGPDDESATRKPAATLKTGPFGDQRRGFAEASSHNGRTVILRRFTGAEPPAFGQHGETAEETQLTLFDRFKGSEVEIDELIDVDPSRRWMLLLNGGELWLLDAVNGRWDQLRNADMDPDGNGCLAPRQAAFSPAGKRIAWIGAGSEAVTVRDLATSDEWVIKHDRRIWRVWPLDSDRGAVLATVAADSQGWPSQATSCVCRWCLRFAASYGTYGWRGPDFTFDRATETGTRAPISAPPEGEREWNGKTGAGCALTPASTQANVDLGPWRWVCPADAP